MTLKWSLTKFKAVEVLSQNFVILCYDKSNSALSVALISVCACIFFLLFADRDHFQLGSLSHLLNAKAGGYQELPDWPEAAPDPSVRNVEVKESVRAVGTVTHRDTGALWGPQRMEGSESCSFPRAVPQRGWTESPEPDTNSNITLIPLSLVIFHLLTAH